MYFLTQMDIIDYIQIILLIFSIFLLLSALILLTFIIRIEKKKKILLEKSSKIDVQLTQTYNMIQEQLHVLEKVAKHEKEKIVKTYRFDQEIQSVFTKTIEEKSKLWISIQLVNQAIEKLETLYIELKQHTQYIQRKNYLHSLVQDITSCIADYNQETQRANQLLATKNKFFGKSIARYTEFMMYQVPEE